MFLSKKQLNITCQLLPFLPLPFDEAERKCGAAVCFCWGKCSLQKPTNATGVDKKNKRMLWRHDDDFSLGVSVELFLSDTMALPVGGVVLLLALILCYNCCYSANCTWNQVDYYSPKKFLDCEPSSQDTLVIISGCVLVFQPQASGQSFTFRSVIVEPTGSLVLINTQLSLTDKIQLLGILTVSNARLEAPW